MTPNPRGWGAALRARGLGGWCEADTSVLVAKTTSGPFTGLATRRTALNTLSEGRTLPESFNPQYI